MWCACCFFKLSNCCLQCPTNAQVPSDVADPFYGVLNAAAEAAALRRALHAIMMGCRGLVAYLLQLRSR